MNDILKKAVENESEQELMKCLNYRHLKQFNSEQFEFIEKALKGTWHSQHEDLVNTIYLGNLRDDRFIEPILNIAINRDVFRSYDGELESTLRKCVHALKTINSKKSNEALEKLKALKNENVEFALEMYKS